MGSVLYRTMHTLLEGGTRPLSRTHHDQLPCMHKMAESACQLITLKQWKTQSVQCYRNACQNQEAANSIRCGRVITSCALMVYQHVRHFMFKEVVKSHYAVHTPSRNTGCGLTCMLFDIRSAGFVPRALKKKLD